MHIDFTPEQKKLAAELRSAVFAAEKLGFSVDEAVALFRELLAESAGARSGS